MKKVISSIFILSFLTSIFILKDETFSLEVSEYTGDHISIENIEINEDVINSIELEIDDWSQDASLKYIWSEDDDTPSNEDNWLNLDTTKITHELSNMTGENYLHIKGSLNEDREIEEVLGPIDFDRGANETESMSPEIDAPVSWTNKPVEVSLTNSQYFDGKIEYRIDGSDWKEYENKILFEDEGEFKLESKTINPDGLESDISQATIKLDFTKPYLNVIEKDSHEGNVVLVAEATDELSGFDKLILPDGEELDYDNKTYIADEDGDYTFQAYDKAGNLTEKTVSVKIPTTDSPGSTKDKDSKDPEESKDQDELLVPNTATNNFNLIIIGAILSSIGSVLFIWGKREN